MQRPRIPVWVGGVLPARGPVARAARWDGSVPIRFSAGSLSRVPASDIAAVGRQVARLRGSTTGFDLVVWAEVAARPAEIPELAGDYVAAGTTWWIETAKPEPNWWEGVQARVAQNR